MKVLYGKMYCPKGRKGWAVPLVLLLGLLLLSGCDLPGGDRGGDPPEDEGPPAIEELLFEIITGKEEAREYLDLGMKILITGEMENIGGVECHVVFLGTDHDDSFVREIHYAVDPDRRQVYRYDILTDSWEALPAD